MGCPTEVELDSTCTFSITTHDPDTGRIADASSLPTWKVYEDAGNSIITSGSMGKVTSTTGFYTQSLSVTSVQFDSGKTYTIFITATVDGDTGGICYGFKAYTAYRANIATLVSRLGAFTGSGVNTVLGFLKAIMSKAATLPSDVGGTFSAATDSLESIRDAVESGNAGTGARTVTVTVNDGSTALESARVRFVKGAATYVQSTNASGNATFNLDDGTYTVSISLTGYTYSGTTQVVDGTETPTYSMSAISITAPSDASLCTVQLRLKLSNTAIENATFKAKLLGVNTAVDGVVLSNEESTDTTDSLGIAELALVRRDQIEKGSGVYKIWVEYEGKPIASVETRIPNQSTCLFEDLLG